jgi:hypothetical protein
MEPLRSAQQPGTRCAESFPTLRPGSEISTISTLKPDLNTITFVLQVERVVQEEQFQTKRRMKMMRKAAEDQFAAKAALEKQLNVRIVCQISEYPSRGGIEPTEINFLTSAD